MSEYQPSRTLSAAVDSTSRGGRVSPLGGLSHVYEVSVPRLHHA